MKSNNDMSVPDESDLKKIVNRMHKRAPAIADAEAQVECAKVALRNLKAKLDKLMEEQKSDEALITIWSQTVPERFTAESKQTIDLGKATVTLRSNPTSIKNLDGWDDDDVIAACEKAGHDEYVRITKKFERAVVKSDWNAQRISDKELKKLGLYADAAVEFKVKLKV